MNLEFMKKFKPEELVLKEFNNWIIVLRQKQLTLGDAVILLKREIPNIADVSPEEFAEFPVAIAWYENKCRTLFGAEKFNYIAAMMKDNFVHFHAMPRYSEEKILNGMSWKDEMWPKPIALKDCETPTDTLYFIRSMFLE